MEPSAVTLPSFYHMLLTHYS